MKVPQFRSFVDKSDYARLEPVFENNYIAEGPFCREFHDRLLDIIGAKYGVFASNGTVAIYLGLKALGIGRGDEVLVQNMSFIASANAVEMVGATPVLADIRGVNDLSIDLDKAEKLITSKTKAVVVAPLFGTANTNIEGTRAFCDRHGLLLVEDAAQALAITNGKKHCGTYGKVATFSFYADKTITTAEGGFVVTDDEEVYENMQYLRNQGRKQSGSFVHPEIGYNFRMTDLQGALGLAQLDKLDHIKQAKADMMGKYRECIGNDERVMWLHTRSDFNHIPFRVVVFVNEAEKAINFMAEREIEPRSVFYPIHRQPCYEYLGVPEDAHPVSNECYQRGICLPTWIGLSDAQIEHVSKALLDSLDA